MTDFVDNVGDTLRQFYAMYGIDDEGPPPNVNVTELLHETDIPQEDIKLLHQAIKDQTLRHDFGICRDIL